QYKERYNKHYIADDDYHRELLDRRVQAVAEHNKLYSQGQVGFRMGITEFSDTDQGILLRYRSSMDIGFVKKPPGYKHYDQISGGIDWRQFGFISAVESQGTECLSCWAFSASGVLVAHLCNGGWVSVAFKHIRQHGIAPKASYPYEPKRGNCLWNPQCSASTLRDYVTLNNYDERELAEVVYNIGPVAVSIDHLHEEFIQYSAGILSIPTCLSERVKLSHSVLLVGFGTDASGQDYWIIKNSYGTEWGENGYFRLARNANNMCGVASLPQYPLV
ncbi:hypothetical protein KR084_002425, partial [Drosophila pseudotakahashii]